MKFTLVLLAAAVSAAPLAAPVSNSALVRRQASDAGFLEKFLCAHDHLHTSQTCNDLKKAAGDKGIIADLLGYSTF